MAIQSNLFMVHGRIAKFVRLDGNCQFRNRMRVIRFKGVNFPKEYFTRHVFLISARPFPRSLEEILAERGVKDLAK